MSRSRPRDPMTKRAAGRKGRLREESDSRKPDTVQDGDSASGSLREWVKTIVVAALLFVGIRSFLVQTFFITSGSMEKTLLVGDMLVVNRAALGSPIPFLGIRIPGYSALRRGDIVVFDPPPPDTMVGMKLVKRVIGLPGDTLQMRNQVLFIDGVARDEPYVTHSGNPDESNEWMRWQKDYILGTVDPRSYAPTRDNWGPLVVPADAYFMMGDNREFSVDSRYWGLVERWRIEGRVSFVYFSYNGKSYRPFPWLREIRWNRIGRAPGRR